MNKIAQILHDAESFYSNNSIPLPSKYLEAQTDIKKFQLICENLVQEANRFVLPQSDYAANRTFLSFSVLVEELDRERKNLDARCLPSILKVKEAWTRIVPLAQEASLIITPSKLEQQRKSVALQIKKLPIEKQKEIMFCFDHQDVILDLSNLDLKTLDRGFFENFPFIKHLDLSNNKLSEIPDLSILENLEYLNVENNNLDILEIPLNCSKLHTLIATGNNLQAPPICYSNSLHHCLWQNYIPDPSNKPNWEELIQAGTNSEKVFKALDKCFLNQTPFLELSNMGISAINPEIFKHFQHVYKLDLSHNPIKSLSGLEFLPRLHELNLNETMLSQLTIPDEIHLKSIQAIGAQNLNPLKMNFLYLKVFLIQEPMEVALSRIIAMLPSSVYPNGIRSIDTWLSIMTEDLDFAISQVSKKTSVAIEYTALPSIALEKLEPWIKKSPYCIVRKKEIAQVQEKLFHAIQIIPPKEMTAFHSHKLFWRQLFSNIEKIPENLKENHFHDSKICECISTMTKALFCFPDQIQYPIQPVATLKFLLNQKPTFSGCYFLLLLSIQEKNILDCLLTFSENDMEKRGPSIALYLENNGQQYSEECRKKIAELLVQQPNEYLIRELKTLGIQDIHDNNFHNKIIQNGVKFSCCARDLLFYFKQFTILDTNIEFRKNLAISLIQHQNRDLTDCFNILNILSEQTKNSIKELAKCVIQEDLPKTKTLKILSYLLIPLTITENDDANFIKDLLLSFRNSAQSCENIIEYINEKFPEIFNDLEFLNNFAQTIINRDNLYPDFFSKLNITRLDEGQRQNLAKSLAIGDTKASHYPNFNKHIRQLQILQKDEFLQEITGLILQRAYLDISDFYGLGIEYNSNTLFKTQVGLRILEKSTNLCEEILSHDPHNYTKDPVIFIRQLIDLSNEENLAKIVKILKTQNKDVYPILFGKLLKYTNISSYASIILDGNWSSVDKDKILKELLFYPDKLMQEFLFKSLLSLEKNQEFNECFFICAKLNKTQKTNKDSKLSSDKILASIIIAKWMAQEYIKEPPIFIKNLLNNARNLFHDPKDPYLRAFLKMTQAIDSSLDFSNDIKLQIVNFCAQILPEKISKGEKSRLDEFSLFNSLVNCCIRCESGLVIEALNEPGLFANNLKEKFTNWIRENLIDETLITELTTKYQVSQAPLMISYEDAYVNFSSSMRVSGSLESYIPNAEKAGILDVFQLFISSVLTKTFYQVRYDIDRSNHLRFLNDNAPEVLQKWKTENFKQIIHFASSETIKEVPLIDFFKDKLSHGHWHINGEDLLPRLTTYIHYKQILPPDPEKNTTLTSIEDQCIELLKQSTNLIQKKKIEKIRELIALMENKGIELCNDLKGLLPSPIQNLSEVIIIISDDPQDLYFSGTEVAGSCQRIDGNPRLCKCLMAYCLDGKIKMLLIKHPITEKILARRTMRLLWDNTTGKPAIFLSRLYTAAGIGDQVDPDLISNAKTYGEKLGVSIFVEGYQNSHILESFGSSAPFEYVDEITTSENRVSSGKFKVSGVST